MRSLFLKIFLTYWLALALFLVLAIVVTLATRQQGESALEAQQAQVLSEAVQAYESGGPEQARLYLDQVRESQHVRAYLLNENEQEITGHRLPEWAKDAERGRPRPPRDFFWGWLMMPMRPQRQSMTSASGHRYTLIVVQPPSGPFGPRGVPGLGVFIAIISSGLVCYLLARYLTAPVVRLRAATQRLAAGDLTARAGVPGGRRHDEIAELVRDFDAMAERLEKLANAQARLLKDISHELRSPLARLNVALGLVRQRTGPEAQSALERIDREAERLNELIGRLLTIARLESGDETMGKIPIPLEELVREIAKDADFEAQSRNCHVEVAIVDDCVVLGDLRLLYSAIENVVRNATRYTKEGTNVEVRLEPGQGDHGPEAILRVTDHGSGVPDEALDKLFRPFYRIDDSRGRQTGGVGLGLAITERAVRLHGGAVRAANQPQGGLMVEIRLPLAPAEGPGAVVAQTIAVAPGGAPD
jgi:two-component system sensor histidine kinase CpxA